ncbi:AraC family transcriptional regulator [Mesorhizobium sanjuanii]|uniref:AraC family transcriptional regulator n=1 Tax=Mesorhizobium sanjuanii TaxID=2037900 RepID=A0A2A6FM30_9HYPH|nr:AraC family transcriptional regulator [Mesorhizobium sanjuanii]PDQ22802.1 AraC family transcriptional regulator [Mesorhizobium sanjuanii]
MDALMDMLRAMRLTGGIFLDAQFSAPWCVSAKVAPEDCVPFTTEPRHIIAYHYVTEGRCLLTVGDQRPVEVESGEIVVLPRNDHHVIASAASLRPVNADHLIQEAPEGGLAKIVYGGGGERTTILCGFLGNDLPHNALITLLPSVLKLNAADGASGDWIKGTFQFAARELAAGQANSPMILAKLAELLFMEAVRRYLASQPPSANAWAAGMQDPVIGRALGILHAQIARRWTTEDLARELAVSRSAFAERFTRAIGEPPMRYLARQRFEQASAQLKETANPIAWIAYEVGYESEEAFNRAFKREYGVPPAAWRRANAVRRS